MAEAAERVLSQRELNRALLERQFLLTRKRETLPRALERIGGIQAQYAPSMYIGLWSRLADVERERLTRALERRTVVQGTLLRSTIHLVSARDYWPFAIGVRKARREWWLRIHSEGSREIAAAAARMRRRLADGPASRAELVESLSTNLFNGAGLWLDMVRVPPSGTWERRRADIYAAADDWLGPSGGVTQEDGIELLVTRYLGGFGPGRPVDVAAWAGLPVQAVSSALDRRSLRRFRDEQGQLLVDLPRAPLPDPDTPAPVRFLPTWDATLLTHARGSGILPEEFRRLVFNTKTPQSVGTFTVDGAVAGSWRHEGGHIRLSPFRRLPRAARGEAEEEAERLAAFQA
ncbi:MAG TPA: winged helix DNA-binding domain-containing protein [Thermoleophilaceae bacterium]